MNFFRRIFVLFSVIATVLFAGIILFYVLHLFKFETISNVMGAAYYDDKARLLGGGIAFLILFHNFIFYKVFSVRKKAETDTISFDNPSGRVNISVTALEDLVKRNLAKMSEIKDAKVKILGSKKNLNVEIKASLATEVDVPNVTAKIQEAISQKLQETIELGDSPKVDVLLKKILPERKKIESKDSNNDDLGGEPQVPFHGYRK